MLTTGRNLFACMLFAGIFSFYSISNACDVPVFRYALEFWPAEPYEVSVYHNEPLSGEQQELLAWLRSCSIEEKEEANFRLKVMNCENSEPNIPPIISSKLPAIAMFYPGSIGGQLVWSGPFNKPGCKILLDSPVRQKVAGHLLVDGKSAVWVLLESGNAEKDNAARQILDASLNEIRESLKLPGGELTEEQKQAVPPLKVDFSLVGFSREDVAESVFIEMLMHSEDDLLDYRDEPMAFPIYGRGRALYTLLGKGINAKNIEQACRFIAGACSCRVKELNPGVDMLFSAKWDEGISVSAIQEVDEQPLVGLSTMARAAVSAERIIPATQEAKAAEIVGTDDLEEKFYLMRNMMIALGVTVIGFTALALWVARRAMI